MRRAVPTSAFSCTMAKWFDRFSMIFAGGGSRLNGNFSFQAFSHAAHGLSCRGPRRGVSSWVREWVPYGEPRASIVGPLVEMRRQPVRPAGPG